MFFVRQTTFRYNTLQLNEWACLQWDLGTPQEEGGLPVAGNRLGTGWQSINLNQQFWRHRHKNKLHQVFIKLIRFVYMTCCFWHFIPVYINLWFEVFLFTCLLRRGCCKMSNRSRMPSNFASSPMHFSTKSEMKNTKTLYFLDLYHI